MSLLPEGYKRLLYIESTGTQWIDTGFVPVATSKVVAEVQYANVASAQYSGLYSGSYMMFGVASSKWEIYLGNKALATSTAAKASRTVVVLDAVNKRGEFNGVSTAAAYTSFGSASLTMPIFALREGINSFRNYSSMKLFSYKIYNANALVRNFIPCINDAGEIGLYETVNGVFCGNNGSGVFIAGPEFWYDELEYIESMGTQHVDTGYMANNNTRAVMDFELVGSGTLEVLFGARKDSGASTYTFMWTDNGFRSDYNTTYNQKWSGTRNTRRTIDKNKETTTVDGTSQSYTNAAFTAPVSLVLFALNNNGEVKWNAFAKLYSCQIYDNDTLVRDYVPAKLPDGSIGLIDKLTEEFYPNMGTGVFTAGKLKPTKYMELEYIESTGTQYVDTGIGENHHLVIDTMFYDINNTEQLMGMDASYGNYFGINGNGYLENGASTAFNILGTVRRVIEVISNSTSQTMTVEGQTLTTTRKNSTSNTVKLLGGIPNWSASARVYSCKFYSGEDIVLDYIPIKLYDGTVGLLDKVSGCFYGNAGTGTFVAGPGKAGEYTLLEYIESTGTQYVDTGFKGNQNSRIVVEAEVATPPSTHAWLFGARNGSSSGARNVFLYSGTTWAADYNSDQTRVKFSGVGILEHLLIDFNKNTLSINGNTHTYTASTFQCNYNTILFGQNNAGAIDNFISARMYSCQIYDNGVVVRDFVPIRTEHGIVALYDLVNESVYDNAGTGVFTAGPNAITVPASPTDLTVQVEGTAAILSWSESKNATAYNVYRNGELLAITEATVFSDTIIASLTTEYAITAINGYGESEPATITVYATETPPVPQNLRSVFSDYSSVQFAWDESIGATSYRVYSGVKLIADTSVAVVAVSGLEKETEYSYSISAVNSVGESETATITVSTTAFQLVTDRTAADVEYVRSLVAKADNMSKPELESWMEGLKGAYNITDLNRVEKAVEYVTERLKVAGIYIYPVTNTNWKFSDFPSAHEMRRYLDNVKTIRSALPTGVVTLPADMDRFTYAEANIIEQVLLMVEAAVTNIMLNVFYSNEIFSGEVR